MTPGEETRVLPSSTLPSHSASISRLSSQGALETSMDVSDSAFPEPPSDDAMRGGASSVDALEGHDEDVEGENPEIDVAEEDGEDEEDHEDDEDYRSGIYL